MLSFFFIFLYWDAIIYCFLIKLLILQIKHNNKHNNNNNNNNNNNLDLRPLFKWILYCFLYLHIPEIAHKPIMYFEHHGQHCQAGAISGPAHDSYQCHYVINCYWPPQRANSGSVDLENGYWLKSGSINSNISLPAGQ